MHLKKHHSTHIASIGIPSITYHFNKLPLNTIQFKTYPFNLYPFTAIPFNTYPFNTYAVCTAPAGMAMNVNTKHIRASYASAGMAMNANTKHILAYQHIIASRRMAVSIKSFRIISYHCYSPGMAMKKRCRILIFITTLQFS